MARPPSPSCWDSGKAPGERRARAAHPPSARLSGAPWRGRRGCFAFGLRCRMMGGRHVCRRRSPMRSCSLLPTGASPRPFRRSGGTGAGGEVSFAPSYCDEEIPHKEYTLSSPWRILCSSGEGAPQVMGFSRLPSGLRHTPAVFHSFHIQFGPRPFGGDSGIGRRGLCSRSARGVRFPGVPGGSQRGGC